MSTDAYKINIFVPNGDPTDLRIFSQMNWTGAGMAFPRDSLQAAQAREELSKSGVYILVGTPGDEENGEGADQSLREIYCGQTDELKKRLGEQDKDKEFWDWACVFYSTNDGLNRAHTTWIEYQLIKLAHACQQAKVANKARPEEPILTEAEKADTDVFLQEILKIMPFMGLHVFEKPKTITPAAGVVEVAGAAGDFDTVVVSALPDSCKSRFLGEQSWYWVRIALRKRPKIKYIAVYQTAPVSAITHCAPVKKIVFNSDIGKCKLEFAEPAVELDRKVSKVPTSNTGIQGLRFTSLAKLKAAKTLNDL